MPAPRAAICAIAKNERSYLHEWVAYHRLIGFEDILVFDNESDDDSAAVLDYMQTCGLVESAPLSVAASVKPQWVAYEAGLERLRGRCDWVAFIDLDEFIHLPRHHSIGSFLEEFSALDALAVNWKMFGSAGQVERGPGLVIERFTRCAPQRFHGNRSIKTLARPDAIETPLVHTCEFRKGVRYQTVTGEVIPPGNGASQTVTHDTIRIHHYFTKSAEEWRAKMLRGRGDKPDGDPRKARAASEFASNDRNEEEDSALRGYSGSVRRIMGSPPLDRILTPA